MSILHTQPPSPPRVPPYLSSFLSRISSYPLVFLSVLSATATTTEEKLKKIVIRKKTDVREKAYQRPRERFAMSFDNGSNNSSVSLIFFLSK